MHLGRLSLSALSVAGWNEYRTRRKLGELTDIPRDTPARIRGFAVFADAWL